MLSDWLPFLIYAVFAAVIPASMIVFSFVFATRPQRRGRSADAPVRVRRLRGGARQQRRFTVSFYLTAMLFILFDIEIVFLYPLAVQLEPLGVVRVRRVPRLRRDPRRRVRVRLAEGGARVALDKRQAPASRRGRPPRRACSSERTLWPTKGPGVFEQELENIEDALCSRRSRRRSRGRSRTRSGPTRSGSPAARSR